MEDGGTCAYLAVTRDNQAVLVVNGRAVRRSGIGYVGVPALSEDGRAYAFAGQVAKDRFRLISSGAEGPDFDGIITSRVSRDGARVAYAGRRGDKRHVVVDGKESDAWDGIGGNPLCFSPDGRHVAYIARLDKAWHVVLDGKSQNLIPYQGVHVQGMAFAPEGGRWAYRATEVSDITSWSGQNGVERVTIGYRVFADDGDHGIHSRTESLVFSPDGRRLAYVGKDSKGGQFVVHERKPGPKYEEVADLVMSADGSTLAHAAKKEGKWYCVVNGRETGPFEKVGKVSLTADGRSVAFAAVRDGRAIVVRDGVAGGAHDETLAVSLSPGGRHLAYWAKLNGKAILVLDERSGEGYDGVLPDSRIAWTGDDYLTAFGYVGGSIWRVQGPRGPEPVEPPPAAPYVRPRPRVRM